MKQNGTKVGLVTFNTLIDACSRVGDMETAARLFADLVADKHGVVPDLITYSTLVKGYCVNGDLEQAMQLFTLMRKKGIAPDAIVYNSLLDGCAKKQMRGLCEQVFADMETAGIAASPYSASILVKLYGRCRDLDKAFEIVEELPKKHGFKNNAAVFTCLMSACCAAGKNDRAFEVLCRMLKEKVAPDQKTYSTLLQGALKGGSAETAVQVLDMALREGSSKAKRLLEEELLQQVIFLLQRRKLMEQHGNALVARLREAGFQVSDERIGDSTSQGFRGFGGPSGSSRFSNNSNNNYGGRGPVDRGERQTSSRLQRKREEGGAN
jgi:pentatricopeptide repeat protein